MPSPISKAALAAAVAGLTLAGAFAPTFAAAQPLDGAYGANGEYGYDACRRERTDRAVTGAVIGGVVGAVVGSQVAAHGVRTEGSLVGGGVGALGGAAVGSSSANCTPGSTSYYEQDRYGYRDHAAYDDDYDYDRDYRAAPISDGRLGPEECRLADSVIYMPDGRTVKRFVRVCRDRSGQYQIVE